MVNMYDNILHICIFLLPFSSPESGAVNILASGPLVLEGEACLEFWYHAPVAPNGSESRVILNSSDGRVQVWASPAQPGNTWRQVFVPMTIIKPRSQVKDCILSITELRLVM